MHKRSWLARRIQHLGAAVSMSVALVAATMAVPAAVPGVRATVPTVVVDGSGTFATVQAGAFGGSPAGDGDSDQKTSPTFPWSDSASATWNGASSTANANMTLTHPNDTISAGSSDSSSADITSSDFASHGANAKPERNIKFVVSGGSVPYTMTHSSSATASVTGPNSHATAEGNSALYGFNANAPAAIIVSDTYGTQSAVGLHNAYTVDSWGTAGAPTYSASDHGMLLPGTFYLVSSIRCSTQLDPRSPPATAGGTAACNASATFSFNVNGTAPGGLSVSDVSHLEGKEGTTPFVFQISLDQPATQAVSVNYATAPVSADSGIDYTSTSGTRNFAVGDQTKLVTVNVKGDRDKEPNETFHLTLSAPSGAQIVDGIGIGTILDDDTCDKPFTAGPDNIVGTAGDDVLCGGDGNDTINGLGGNDTIYGGDGRDLVYGGPGDDTIYGGGGRDTINGDADEDVISGGAGDDRLNGGSEGDIVFGDAGDDTVDGGDGNDILDGKAGDDEVIGGFGGDLLRGGDDNDFVRGDADNDEAYGGDGRDQVFGGTGDDTLYGDDIAGSGESGRDELHGGADEDTMSGGPGDDFLYGDADNDIVYGDAGDDHFVGGHGSDIMNGKGGRDAFDACDDTLDQLFGGGGADHAFIDQGLDTFDSVESRDSC